MTDLSQRLNDILFILFEAQKANNERVSKALVAGVIEIIFTWCKEMEIEVTDLRVTDEGTGSAWPESKTAIFCVPRRRVRLPVAWFCLIEG